MQKAMNRVNQPENADAKSVETTATQLPGSIIDFDVAKIFYPGEEKITRRYSIDDNGGGYMGL